MYGSRANLLRGTVLVPRRAGVEDQRHDVAELSTAGERAVTGTLQLQYASRHRRATLREGLSDAKAVVVERLYFAACDRTAQSGTSSRVGQPLPATPKHHQATSQEDRAVPAPPVAVQCEPAPLS